MDVVIQHVGLDLSIGDVSVFGTIDSTSQWEEIYQNIIKSVGKNLMATLLLHTPTILIIGTDKQQYILNDAFIRKNQPFNTNTHKPDDYTVKVLWLSRKNTQPIHSNVVDAATQTDSQAQATGQSNNSSDSWFAGFFYGIRISNGETKNNHPEVEDDELLEICKNTPPLVFSDQQNNLNLMASFNDPGLNSASSGNISWTSNQSRLPSKRSKQLEGGTTAKKRPKCIIQQDQLENNLMTEIVRISILPGEQFIVNIKQYDKTMVPLISNFAWDEMIHFIHNVDRIKKELYLSGFKRIPCLQRRKPDDDDDKPKTSMLPELELPLGYQNEITGGGFALMGFACVMEQREFRADGKEEIELCRVGYKQFICYPDENKLEEPMAVIYPNEQEEKADQLIFKITSTTNKQNAYILKAHPFKVKDRLHKEIGPVLFRLSTEYIQVAREKGFEFDKIKQVPRYVAYLLKYDEQLKYYKLDLNSLVLSDYTS